MLNNNISIVGLGYVGLPLALLSAKKGLSVVGIDLNTEKIDKINNRIDPIGDEYVENNISGTTLKAFSDYHSIETSKIVIVCVPTPVRNGNEPDLKILEAAIESIAVNIANGTLIIVESTINPGVCDEIVIPLIESKSGKKLNQDFYVSHCPERINPGDKKWSVENIPRVVGSSNKIGLDLTVEFYEKIIDAPVKQMNTIKEAEAVKIVENSFRDVNLAFVNELAMSFTKLGIDVKNVIDGAATKPFAFMPHYPSVGIGGHCIPVDPYYLIEYARSYDFEHEFLSLARSINNRMPEFTVSRLIDGLAEVGLALKDAKIAVLGLSYKANVSDDRESPSYKLINVLNDKDAVVTSFDPHILSKSSVKSLSEALEDKDAVVLATSHDEFKAIDIEKLKVKVFVDGKNVFDPLRFSKCGIVYRGIGR